MGLLDKLFGKKTVPEAPTPYRPAPLPAAAPAPGSALLGEIEATARAARAAGASGFLHVYEGASRGTSVFLGAHEPVAIGRAPENALAVQDPGVSSRHAEVCPDGKGFCIFDLGSKNGTYVNDEPVTEKALHHGDVIAFGETRIYVGIL